MNATTTATVPPVCDAHAAQQWSTCDCSATTKTLPTWTPAQVDEALAEVYGRAAVPQARAAGYAQSAIDAEFPRYGRPDPERAARYEALRAEAELEWAVIMEEARPYNTEYYRRGGWTRGCPWRRRGRWGSTRCRRPSTPRCSAPPRRPG